MNLSGARILVTGASGALGGRIARNLCDNGSRLCVSGRNGERLRAIAAELDASSMPGDLREVDAAMDIVDAAVEHLGGLDGVVHAAGVVAFGPMDDLSDATLAELVEVNLMAPIRLTRAAASRLAEGGVIVSLSAVVATIPTAGMAAYSAVKAGLTAFDQAAGRELRRRGIRLLGVCPPHTATGLETRPIAGTAPKLPPGRDPDEIVARIVAAMRDDTARAVSFDDR